MNHKAIVNADTATRDLTSIHRSMRLKHVGKRESIVKSVVRK